MSSKIETNPPIFLIGTGRNGSTLISDILAVHPSLFWISNYQDKFPKLLSISRSFQLFRKDDFIEMGSTTNTKNKINWAKRWIPRQSEAYHFWNQYAQMDFAKSFMPNLKASPAQIDSIQKAVNQVGSNSKGSTFFSKLTGPPRVTFLNSVFPNAQFIQIVRDFRLVLRSYLNSFFWEKGGGFEGEWWSGTLSVEDLELWQQNKRPEVLAALQLRNIVLQSIKELDAINPQNVLTLKYEDFLENPIRMTEHIFAFSGLTFEDSIRELIQEKQFYNKELDIPYTDDELVRELLDPILDLYGYPTKRVSLEG